MGPLWGKMEAVCGNPSEINAGCGYHSKKGQIASLDPIRWAVAKHVEVSPAWAVILHLPTFASATIHPPVNRLGRFVQPRAHRPITLEEPSRKPRGCQLLWNWPRGVGPIGSCLYHPDPLLGSVSGNSGSCVLLEKKKNDLQNDTYLWQECALEQNKAKISHSNTICKSVYKYASWLNLSSFWLLTCPVLLCHPHKNVFY